MPSFFLADAMEKKNELRGRAEKHGPRVCADARASVHLAGGHVSVLHFVPRSLFTRRVRVRSHPRASVHTADVGEAGVSGTGQGMMVC